MKYIFAVITWWYTTLVGAQTSEIQGVPVLMYHRITNAAQPSTIATPIKVFEQHLDALQKAGYQTITISSLVNRLEKPGRAPNSKLVAITFDDGWKDNMLAAEMLSERGMVGTFFVLSNAFDDPQYLSRNDLAFIARRHEVGTHSHTHFMQWVNDLKQLDNRVILGEIVLSKVLIEQATGKQVTSFAWPFGYVRPELRSIIHDVGITGVVEVNGESNNTLGTNPLAIHRLAVSGNCTQEQFMVLVETRKMGACPLDDKLYSQ